MPEKCEYTAYIDVASSGNPGDAGIGVVVYRDGEEIARESKYIGKQTNNVAEYSALIRLLEMLENHSIKEVKVYSDSELLVKQVLGEYKIKNEALRELMSRIAQHKKRIKFTIEHVRREKNSEADKLAKAASKRGEMIQDV
ncbi:MAG TPA: ribonuclease HI family protein [Candidatus Goldiibacteriota bacterium]|nr:ribonuclease HI family protein [Candidatus Goldiibacteriota bacterium]